MNTLWEILMTAEFWMAMSLVAAVLPGPQTRFLPGLFKAVSKAVGAQRGPRV